MNLAGILEQNREAVLERWFGLIAESYPRETAAFLANQKDPFRNPVGHAVSDGIGRIYDQIASSMDVDALGDALDPIIRIRSVQEFSPSEAVVFVFQLKVALRAVLGDREFDGRGDTLGELDARIDRLALLAFDKYTECREQLHEVRIHEIRGRASRVMEWMNEKSGDRCRREAGNDE